MIANNKEGIITLEKVLPRLNDSNIYTYIGHAYMELGQIEKAEQYFKHASHIVPSKIYPLYKLVKTYQKKNQKEKAIQLAQKIISMGEKVETKVGRNVINEMNEFLN